MKEVIMRKLLNTLIIIGFIVSVLYSDEIHKALGSIWGDMYFFAYLFLLAFILAKNLAWAFRD